jgi:cytochrome c peroxidase
MEGMMKRWSVAALIAGLFAALLAWGAGRAEAAHCAPTPGVAAADDVAFGDCLFHSRSDFGQNPAAPFASCAACHYGDNFRDRASHFNILRNAKGKTVQVLRNTPTLFNAADTAPYSWDGRNATIQAQALEAILNPREMAGAGASADQLDALAAFVKGLTPPESAYDRFIAGDSTALSAEAVNGMNIFLGKGTCATCHTPPLFTNNQIATNQKNATFSGRTDPGAGFVGTGPVYSFNVPQLRAVALTGPYMHNGALGTLGQVVRFYNQSLALGLTEMEMRDLIEFLRAL